MSRLFLLRAPRLLHRGVARSDRPPLRGVRHSTELLCTSAGVAPDMAVDIEHEDAAYHRPAGLSPAAETLRAAAAKQ